jgi:hypothetical protein
MISTVLLYKKLSGEALEAILLPLQGEKRSLERAVELDQTVATHAGAQKRDRIIVRSKGSSKSHKHAIVQLCDWISESNSIYV